MICPKCGSKSIENYLKQKKSKNTKENTTLENFSECRDCEYEWT